MAESQANRLFQAIRHPYFLPASIIIPLTSYWLYSSLKPKPTYPPAKPHECRFRLDTETSATVTLPDGRKLGYAEYGSPTGRPVLGMHGSPGSRLEWAFWDELGKKHNARIIGIDRPGHGWSTFHQYAKAVDFVKDVQCLIEHLNLDEYVVLGCSGGGPSTLLCAHSLPADKMKGASVVVGVAEPGMSWKGSDLMHKIGFGWGFVVVAPWVTRTFWRFQTLPKAVHMAEEEWAEDFRAEWFASNIHPKDKAMASDAEFRNDFIRVIYRSMRQAFADGVAGTAEDVKVMCADWGAKISEIRPEIPLQLWYGKSDVFIPPIIGTQIAERFRGKAELHIVDETHGSLQWNFQEQILTDLLRCFES